MTDLHIKVSGAWKTIDDASVKVSGAWKQVDEIYVKVSGAWKSVWAYGVVALSGETISNLSSGTAAVRVNTDGTVDKLDPGASQIDASTDWIIPNSAASSLYEVSWSQVSGDTPSYSNMAVAGTWYDLSVSRYVGYQPSPGAGESGVIRLSIRFNGGATIDTGDYDITGVEPP